MTLGEKLKARRKALGMSQQELAESIGVTRASVCNWEADQREPSFFAATCLADALGLTLNYLAGKEECIRGQTE